MTNEEAIEELKEEFEIFKNGISSTDWENPNKELKKIIEANTMAIKALEQQPCEDCISRAEMLKYQEYLHGKMSNEENHRLWEFIKDLPSVTPQPKIGKWNEAQFGGFICSECGNYTKGEWSDKLNEMTPFKYCPECGAKMEVEENE